MNDDETNLRKRSIAHNNNYVEDEKLLRCSNIARQECSGYQLPVRHTRRILDVAYRDICACTRSFRLRPWGLHPGLQPAARGER
jgi:hypothetical protein